VLENNKNVDRPELSGGHFGHFRPENRDAVFSVHVSGKTASF